MQQYNPGEHAIIEVDFDDPSLPEPIRTLRPVVYEMDLQYHCILGPDPESGIYASGKDVQEVLMKWDTSLKKRITNNDRNDPVTLYIIDALNASVRKTG